MPLPIKEEELDHITKKVYALYATHGFSGISMDEISRQTGISKATLYRYFTSKEDIVRGMVDYMTAHLDSVQFTPVKKIRDVMAGLREFYKKSVLVVALSGSKFLSDLKNKFPDCYDVYYTSLTAMQDRFEEFYENLVRQGYFRELPFKLVIRQFSVMLPAIIDMDYLESVGMSLPEALREYYHMFFCQILTEQYLSVVDREETYEFIDELTGILLDDFFLDSIRR